MIPGAVADRIIAAVYGTIPASSAVSILDVGPDEILPSQAPGAPDQRRPSLMVRCREHCRQARREWTAELPFPNPAQACVLALIVSLTFLLGGPQRFASATYDVIRTYGGVSVWGLGFLLLTVGVLVAWRWLHHGLFLAYVMAASAYTMLALAVAQSALRDESVSWLAVGVFGWLAWVHSMAATRVSDEWRIERWVHARFRRRHE